MASPWASPLGGVFTNKAEQGVAVPVIGHGYPCSGPDPVDDETTTKWPASLAAPSDKIGPVAPLWTKWATIFGNWDPAKYELEDSAFGFVRMKKRRFDQHPLLLGDEYHPCGGHGAPVRYKGRYRREQRCGGTTMLWPTARWIPRSPPAASPCSVPTPSTATPW